MNDNLVGEGDGSGLKYTRLPTSVETVDVPVESIKDSISSGKEEIAQLSIAGFFASGSLWLCVERAFTVAEFWKDPLFLVCLVTTTVCAVSAISGYRQTMRRVSRLSAFLPEKHRTG